VINHTDFFLYALLILVLVLPLGRFIRSLRSPQNYANPAEHRKQRAALRSARRWSATAVLGFVVSVLALTVIKGFNERGVILSPAEPFTLTGDLITIPLEQIQDGHLHRFAHITDTTEIRFIIIRKSEAAYGVGLDACDICGPTGYYERKNQIICRLCDVVMNISTIGFYGGCNPVPLAYSLDQGRLIIQLPDLLKEEKRFK
jgi:uncharacterized membrane protein